MVNPFMIEEIRVSTPDKIALVDITNEVEQIVQKMPENPLHAFP